MKMVSFRKALTGAIEWIVDANILREIFFWFPLFEIEFSTKRKCETEKKYYFYSFLIDFYSLNEKSVLLPTFGFIGKLNIQVKC